jgi:hypothetical protein
MSKILTESGIAFEVPIELHLNITFNILLEGSFPIGITVVRILKTGYSRVIHDH